MSNTRARELAAALGQWAANGSSLAPESLGWAISTADSLVSELMRLERAAEAQRLWSLPDHPFARTAGRCLHTRDCLYVGHAGRGRFAHWPLTRSQAASFLRESRDHRRCRVCAPDIPEPAERGEGLPW